jgi:CRP/FNR family transcriptional regulator, cyclic AMP receptor protein
MLKNRTIVLSHIRSAAMIAPSAAELARVPLLAVLAPDELQAAAQRFNVRLYPKGAILLSEGDRPDAFSFMLSGEAMFFWRDEQGRQLDIATLGPGEHFADATFGGEPALASLIALEDLRVASIPMEDFEHLLLEHPKLAVAFVKRLIQRFRRRLEATRVFAMEDVYGRVTQLLMSQAIESDGKLLTGRLTQEEIARRVGATREMVGRVLRDLTRGGYLRVERGRFEIVRKLPRRW